VNTVQEAERLILLGKAYGLCARLLAPPAPLPPQAGLVRELRTVLRRLGNERALAALQNLVDACQQDPERLQGEYTRLFLQNRVPPYETSYLPKGSQGSMRELADIAGFYRAFGFRTHGEKPDHLGAELEFVALLCIKEAYARLAGDGEGAQTCAEARRKFWLEHLEVWLPPYSHRLVAEAYHPAFAALASLLQAVAMGK
jgi:TorA maturation chaperone TorD